MLMVVPSACRPERSVRSSRRVTSGRKGRRARAGARLVDREDLLPSRRNAEVSKEAVKRFTGRPPERWNARNTKTQRRLRWRCDNQMAVNVRQPEFSAARTTHVSLLVTVNSPE